MLFIIFARCLYLSQSVPLIFPVTQVAILTHLCHILPHKGSIKRSQLSLRREPIPFHSTCDFTIYLQHVWYLYHMSWPQHNNFFGCCGGNTCWRTNPKGIFSLANSGVIRGHLLYCWVFEEPHQHVVPPSPCSARHCCRSNLIFDLTYKCLRRPVPG